ncbi:MAG: hypothetical protein CMP84_16655 [Gammaproteobacteria bacterium]|nr:hypothetical protein [Gammaproteobacteria bacterium]
MNYIDQMRQALNEVADTTEYLAEEKITEGAIADKMRANLKAKKKSWDEKGEKAKADGYKALDHAKKTQDDLEKSDFIQNVGESYKKYLAKRIKYWCNS